MSYDYMAKIREWHRAVEERHYHERDPREQTLLHSLREKLIWEECDEVSKELTDLMAGRGSLARLAKELVDLLYVVFGTADLYDIPVEDIFELVHQNNMSKVDQVTGKVVRRADGKVLKPEWYRPVTEEDVWDRLNGA